MNVPRRIDIMRSRPKARWNWAVWTSRAAMLWGLSSWALAADFVFLIARGALRQTMIDHAGRIFVINIMSTLTNAAAMRM